MTTNEVRTAAERRGRLAERICVWSLRLRGWRILARRLSGRRGTGVGEIDIIARRGRTVAFIEVKARSTYAAAVEAITPVQRMRIVRAAEVFIAGFPDRAACDFRFDVMILSGLLPVHIVDAWRPD